MTYSARALFGLLLIPILLAGCGSGPRTQVLLETDLPAGQCVTQDQRAAIQQVLQQRSRYLGLGGARVQPQDQGCAGRFIVDWQATDNPESVVKTLKSPGLFEFVEIGPSAGSEFPKVQPGVYLRTTNNPTMPDVAALDRNSLPYPDTVFKTVLTGSSLKSAKVELDSSGAPGISFELDDEGKRVFAGYTASHIGDILALVLDNLVLSAPRIQSAIPEGKGVISGSFTRQDADSIAAQMRSGALPTPLRVLEVGAAPAGN